MHTNDDNDLDWLAFRYISSEMSASEVDSFEERLGADQSAREAVARAVDLAQAVASAPCQVIPMATHSTKPLAQHARLAAHAPRSRRRFAPGRWVAAAAAAIVLGVLGYQLFTALPESTTLAKLWASVRFGHEADAAEYELLADDDSTFDEQDDLTVPAWLIEAVQGGADSERWEES